MKKIGFIGAFDKTDMIIYVAKLFAEIGKKVLIIIQLKVFTDKIAEGTDVTAFSRKFFALIMNFFLNFFSVI